MNFKRVADVNCRDIGFWARLPLNCNRGKSKLRAYALPIMARMAWMTARTSRRLCIAAFV